MANKKRVEMDWSLLHGMLIYDASAPFCAWKQGISVATLERNIKAKYDMTFGQYKALYIEETAISLKTKIINKALAGDNACLIFSLKNVSNWSDKVEHGLGTNQQSIVLRYSLDKPKTVIDSGDGSK